MNCSIGIEPNPDLSGIGVRASIYIQVLLPLLPEIVILLATRSVPRSDVARRGLLSSATILITGYAMLFSAIIQAKTKHLTVYHALLTLYLNWLICLASTESCYFFLLKIIPFSSSFNNVVAGQNPSPRLGRTLNREETSLRRVRSSSTSGRSSSSHRNSSHGSKSLRTMRDLISLGGLILLVIFFHLSLTSAFGVWVFSNLKAFDKQTPSCTDTTIMSVFGADFNVSTSQSRNAWLAIYSLCLLTVFNFFVVFLTVAVFWSYAVHIWWIGILLVIRRHELMSFSQYFKAFQIAWMPWITIISFTLTEILFIVSTELTIHRNNVQAGEDDWSLGQILALFLILPALWQAVRHMYVAYKEHGAGEDTGADVQHSPSPRLPEDKPE